MEDGLDTFNRPEWWNDEYQRVLDALPAMFSIAEVVDFFDNGDDRLNIFYATDLWQTEAHARVNGSERVLSQYQFGRFTRWLMAYADRKGVYSPYLWEVFLALTAEKDDPDEDGDVAEIAATDLDDAHCRHLCERARGEIDRLRLSCERMWEFGFDERVEAPEDGIPHEHRSVAMTYQKAARCHSGATVKNPYDYFVNRPYIVKEGIKGNWHFDVRQFPAGVRDEMRGVTSPTS